jgi:hypothetical protein
MTRPGPSWPGPGNPPRPQIINELPCFWWEQAYRDGIGRMRGAGWTWSDIADYMKIDETAAEAAWNTCAPHEP